VKILGVNGETWTLVIAGGGEKVIQKARGGGVKMVCRIEMLEEEEKKESRGSNSKKV